MGLVIVQSTEERGEMGSEMNGQIIARPGEPGLMEAAGMKALVPVPEGEMA